MNHIQKFKIFESDETRIYSNVKAPPMPKNEKIPNEVTNNIKDMALDIKDDGFTLYYQMWPDSQSYRKMISKFPCIIIRKIGSGDPYKLHSFQYLEISDFVDRVENYLNSEGYDIIVRVSHDNPDGAVPVYLSRLRETNKNLEKRGLSNELKCKVFIIDIINSKNISKVG